MTLEELDKALTHPNIAVFPHPETPELCRTRTFVLDHKAYTIEWWCNVIYLKRDGILVCADHVKQSGTWPNSAKLNLQFTMNGTTVCVIELEKEGV